MKLEQGHRAISLKPSDAKDPKARSYGEPESRIRISGRSAIHPYSKVIKYIATCQSKTVANLEQEYSLEIVKSGWANSNITYLSDLTDKLNALSVHEDDRNIDSVLDQATMFSVGNLDEQFITVTVYNEKVRGELSAQASVCASYNFIYIQIEIIRKILAKIDWCKENHKHAFDLGKSEQPLRDVITDFDKWVSFRVKHLEFILSTLGKSSEPDRV